TLPFRPARSHNGAEAPHSPTLQNLVDPLPRLLPAMRPNSMHDGSPLYEIAARSFRQQLHRDLPPTRLWGYAGQFPGPTFDVRRGQKIYVRWLNELSDTEFLIPQAFDR